MRRQFSPFIASLALVVAGLSSSIQAADNYKVDGVHSSISFKVQHLGLSWIHGRFNDFSGSFSIDKEDPTKSTFEMSIKVDTVDTNNKGRDGHLKSPDFFNTKQFPTISFKSTGVKAVDGGLEVTGDMTMHGETKSITFTLKGGKEAKFMGSVKTGYATDFSIKRSEFGMDKMTAAIGDEIQVSVGFEGGKK